MKKILARVENLHISFPSSNKKNQRVEVVRGASFDIPEKTIVGFIGESGSGKSVTAKSMLGINYNSKSRADKFNVSGISFIKDEDKKALYEKSSFFNLVRGKKVAYIPQDSLSSLNPTKRIGKQIVESLELHNTDLRTKDERYGYAIELLEKFGISDARARINSYPHEFSGGMRQRVVIAMMIACSPDIIIADEPTTALDPTVQASVLKLFEDIVEEYNTSILFISHDISVIATLCDYINVFYAGRIVEKGTKKDIFTNPSHPYTWALLASMPELFKNGEKLFTIDGQPPNFENLPMGDPFSVRNKYALKVDFKKEPPLFKISETHQAATWLLHPDSPKVKPPKVVVNLIKKIGKDL